MYDHPYTMYDHIWTTCHCMWHVMLICVFILKVSRFAAIATAPVRLVLVTFRFALVFVLNHTLLHYD